MFGSTRCVTIDLLIVTIRFKASRIEHNQVISTYLTEGFSPPCPLLEIDPHPVTLDAQVAPHIVGQHAGEIARMRIVARSARQGLPGPGVEGVTAHGVRVLQVNGVLVASVAEVVDLHRQQARVIGPVRIVTFRAPLGHRWVQVLPAENAVPVMAREADRLTLLQEEILPVPEVGIVAGGARALLRQRLVEMRSLQFFLRIVVAVEAERRTRQVGLEPGGRDMADQASAIHRPVLHRVEELAPSLGHGMRIVTEIAPPFLDRKALVFRLECRAARIVTIEAERRGSLDQ